MSLSDQLQEDLNKVLKDHDVIAASTLRMAISNIKNARIAKGADLSEEETLSELLKDAKRHKESIAAFESASRTELAQKEKAELEVLSKYLPQQMSKEEIEKVVGDVILELIPSGIGDMGKVMSQVMAKVGKNADGGLVSSIVREKLS